MTIDKAGRVAEVCNRVGLTADTELEMVIEGFAIRLVRAVAGSSLSDAGEHTEVDIARLIEEER